MRLAIAFVHTPTLRTGSGDVVQIDEHDRNAGSRRFVSDLLSQVIETPGMVLSPLAFTNRYPLTDALQVLQSKPATGVFRPLHQLLRDPMIFLSGKTVNLKNLHKYGRRSVDRHSQAGRLAKRLPSVICVNRALNSCPG